ncbi:MAG: OmpA family protein [Proteobacteria bacterium]|nr:OmpA family protein [Pseudomonadota bacterium]
MKLTTLTLSVCTVLLSACGADYVLFPDHEVQPEVRNGPFGSAVASNVAVQSGQTAAMLANLTRKFASEVPPTINFEFNSSQLDGQARSALQQQAAWIKAHPQITFTVYGHTDKVGGASFNKALGQKRARTTVNYMISLGVSRSKVRAVASFGETRPIVITEDRNRQNRRTVTEVTGFSQSGKKGGKLDGKYALEVYNRYITMENQTILTEKGQGAVANSTVSSE